MTAGSALINPMRSRRFKKCFLSTDTSAEIYNCEGRIQIAFSSGEAAGFFRDYDDAKHSCAGLLRKKNQKSVRANEGS
jgi:hypothetical protein